MQAMKLNKETLRNHIWLFQLFISKNWWLQISDIDCLGDQVSNFYLKTRIFGGCSSSTESFDYIYLCQKYIKLFLKCSTGGQVKVAIKNVRNYLIIETCGLENHFCSELFLKPKVLRTIPIQTTF